MEENIQLRKVLNGKEIKVYPKTKSENVTFADGDNLQHKFDAGELGGGSSAELKEHIANQVIHINKTERDKWNGIEKKAKDYTDQQVNSLIDTAPEALDTLKELSAALGNDPNFSTTVMTEIGKKAPTSHAANSNIHGVSTSTLYGHAMASSATPLANGTATTGVDNGKYAREGHVHPVQTSVSGNAGTATKLATARKINGTNFDGTGDITTSLWGTARTLTIGKSGKSVNGGGNVSWSLAEIGALPLTGGTLSGELIVNGGVSPIGSWSGTTANTSVPNGLTIANNNDQLNGFLDIYTTALSVKINENRNFQIAVNNGGSISFRSGHVNNTGGTGTGFNAWRKIYHEGFKPSASDIGALPSGGNAVSATKLQTARQINGTNFDGTSNISTAYWGTGRTLTIGNSGKTVNGSGNVSWSLAEIGAADKNHEHDNLSVSNMTYIAAPKDGRLRHTTSSSTGYLKITLPQSWTNTMIMFSVDVFNYKTNCMATYVVGGYNYNADAGRWVNVSAYCLSHPQGDKKNLTVRFGHDGSKCAIYIGEESTVWEYNQVTVKDITVGYSSYELSKWISGWGVSTSATLGKITATVENTFVGHHVHSTLTRGSYLVGGNFNGTSAQTWSVDATTTNTASKVVARDSSGDIHTRLLRSEYANQDSISGAIAYRVNNSSDNYVRYCSNPTAIRNWLGAAQSSHTHNYLPLTGGTLTGNVSYNLHGTTQIPLEIYGGDANGTGLAIGSGGATIISSGEGKTQIKANLNATVETTAIGSDQAIEFHTSLQNGWASRKSMFMDTNGVLTNSNGFSGNLTGNSTTATKLQTARTINGVSFDGTSNITISASANGGTSTATSYVNSNNTEVMDSRRLQFFQTTENTNLLPDAGWWSLLRTQHNGYANGYWQEMAYSFSSDTIKFRRNTNGQKHAWRTIAFIDSNVSSATKLQTARSINGTNFDGTGNITTASWGTARTLTIGNTGKSVNGSGNVSWSLAEIGAKASNWVPAWGDVTGKPSTFAPIIGTAANQAAAGNHNHDSVYSQKSSAAGEFISGYTVTNANDSALKTCFRYMSSSATAKPPGDDHALLTMAYNTVWKTQLAQDWRTNRAYIRACNNGSWGSWAELYSTANKPTAATVGALPLVGGNLSGPLRMTGTHNIYLPHNCGICGVDTGGSDRYLMFMDTSNRVHIGYMNGNPILLDSKVDVTGRLYVTGESRFTQGAYSDPWYGVVCAAKFSGNVGIREDLRIGRYAYYGITNSGLQACIYPTKKYYGGSNKNFLMMQVWDPLAGTGAWEDAMGLTTEGGNEIMFSAPLYPSEAGGFNLGGSTYRWKTAYLVNNPSVSSDYSMKNNIEYIDGGTFISKRDYTRLEKKSSLKIKDGDCRDFIKNMKFATYFYNNYEIEPEYGTNENGERAVINRKKKLIESTDEDFNIGFVAQDLLNNNVGQSILNENESGELSYNTGSYTSAIARALHEEIKVRDEEILSLRERLRVIEEKLGL